MIGRFLGDVFILEMGLIQLRSILKAAGFYGENDIFSGTKTI